MFTVKQIGQSARDLCHLHNKGEVHSVFSHNMNITLSPALDSQSKPIITLCGESANFHTANLLISPNPTFLDWEILRGDAVIIGENRMRIGNNVTITGLESAALWQSDIIRIITESGITWDRETKTMLLKRIDRVLQQVPTDCHDGFYPLVPLFWEMMEEARNGVPPLIRTDDVFNDYLQGRDLLHEDAKQRISDRVCYMAYHAIVGLMRALEAGNLDLAHNAAGRLVGLGSGLTPSGDDFLSGFLAVQYIRVNAFHEQLKDYEILKEAVRPHISKTTGVSEHFLAYALDGQMSENTEHFMMDMFRPDEPDMIKRMNDLLAYGATSGLDQLLGLLAGLVYSVTIK